MQDESLDPLSGEPLGDRTEVLGPTGEHEAVPASVSGEHDVIADRRSPPAVLDKIAESRLYVLTFLGDLMIGFVHDHIESSQRGAERGGHGVTHRATVHGHHGLKTVPAIRGGGAAADRRYHGDGTVRGHQPMPEGNIDEVFITGGHCDRRPNLLIYDGCG